MPNPAVKKKGRLSLKAVSLQLKLYSGRILNGGWETALYFLVFGFLIFLFLMNTVHQRSLGQLYQASGPRTQEQPIQFWIEQGYLKNGGLIHYKYSFWDSSTPKGPDAIYAYRSNSGFYLQLGHLVQRINSMFGGSYSYPLIATTNQVILWILASLFGYLCMRLSMRLRIEPLYSLLLGMGAASVYYTFPGNLFTYWAASPVVTSMIFLMLFFIAMERVWFRWPKDRGVRRLLSLAVFFFTYSLPVGAVFLLGAFGFFYFVMQKGRVRWARVWRHLAVPGIFGIAAQFLQVLWVKFWFPDRDLMGSAFLERSGLDGSQKMVSGDQWEYFFYRSEKLGQWLTKFPHGFDWYVLFAVGCALILFFVVKYPRSPRLRMPLLVVATILGGGVSIIFMFSQASVIHPYDMDAMIFPAFVIIVFALFPSYLEALTRNKGLYTFLFVVMAFCYSMVQLRNYSLMFPH